MARENGDGGTLFSVRMRAARGGPHEAGGRHVSGAERLLPEREVAAAVRSLVRRAQEHPLGAPDFIQVTVERVETEPVRIPGLPVTTVAASAPGEARRVAAVLLASAGVAPATAARAIEALAGGPGPGGGTMRGAMLMDAATGARLEPDPARGVRVTRVDVAPEARREVTRSLSRGRLIGTRVREALVLASKVAWAGALAELCWSDDPDYTTGYVASPAFGYVRLTHLKPRGTPLGGRVFFLPPGADPAPFVHRLEAVPVLLTGLGGVRPPVEASDFLKEIARDAAVSRA